jgi:hypothetical protein
MEEVEIYMARRIIRMVLKKQSIGKTDIPGEHPGNHNYQR